MYVAAIVLLGLGVIGLFFWNRCLIEALNRKHRDRRRRLEEELVLILRNRRHGFMNDLQVISGWLQLHKPERAQEYLDQVVTRLEAEGTILRLGSPSVVLAVLSGTALAETYGVKLECNLQGAEGADDHALLEDLAELMAAVFPEVARRSPEPTVDLTYQPISSGHCYVIQCQLGSAPALDLDPIARKIKSQGGTLDQKTEEGRMVLRLTWPQR